MKFHANRSTFIVTGGASGLGEGCVRTLFSSPYHANVVIVDMDRNKGEALEKALNSQGRENVALFYKLDVTNEDDAKNVIRSVVDRFQIISGLINCAGIGTLQRLLGEEDKSPVETFRKTMDINVLGTFVMMRLVGQQMVKQDILDGERGVIINTASVAAFDGQVGQVSYSASKGAIVAMTLPIARELSRYAIRCVAVAPGLFSTPMMQLLPESLQKKLVSDVPFPKRMGDPKEFAHICISIFENQMLNGEVIRLDGCLRMKL